MSANSLSFRYEPDQHNGEDSVVVLLPVWAYECEVHPPYERELDAYEDAVLRMVRINMGVNSIANALNASQSLIGTVLSNLQDKGFVEKQKGYEWSITNDAQVYFDGYYQEKASEKAEYGFMFASALRKDVLPYYHSGSLDNIKLLFNGFEVLRNGNEKDTFAQFLPDNRALGKAYSNFRKAVKVYNLQIEQKISIDEANQIVADQFMEDKFADLDSLDEYDVQEVPAVTTPVETALLSVNHDVQSRERLVVRRLNKPPKRRYLRLRIVFDPAVMNGFRVESPFDMRGIDNSWYLRQIQWMMNSDEILLDKAPIRQFIEKESVKLGYNQPEKNIDFSVYVLDKLPSLKLYRDQLPEIYDSFEDIYGYIQRQGTLRERKDIVNNLCTDVLEALYRRLFCRFPSNVLKNIKKSALSDMKSFEIAAYRTRVFQLCGLPANTLQNGMVEAIKNAADHLDFSKGNGLLEKMYNAMLLYYYAPNSEIRKYIEMDNFQEHVESLNELNRVRITAAHKADHPFTEQSYIVFMNKVYPVADRLIKAIVGGN